MVNNILENIRQSLKVPSISRERIVRKGKDIIAIPAQHEPISSIRERIRLPSIDKEHIVNQGRHLISQGSYYEAMFYNKISNYSIPSISEIYGNSKFKTGIYRAEEESPCLDEIFYKYENLIPYGKEYWFAIFTSYDGRKPMQLVSCFGRRNTRRSVVDDVEVNGLNPTGNELNTGTIAWCYDGKRKLMAPTVETKTLVGDKSIVTEGNNLKIGISGTVPEYRVGIESDEINCDFKVTKPPRGYDEEILNEIKMGMNYQVYNLYYDFKGVLNGREHEGRCYLQKVILSTPLVPWHWSRIAFKDGSSLVFFKPYFGSKEFNYPLRNKGAFYSAEHDKLTWFYNIDVTHDKTNTKWRFRSRGDGYSLDASIFAYANHTFNFRSGGAFAYNEYMVNVKKIRFEAEDVKVTGKDLGPGVGMFEDATGILI